MFAGVDLHAPAHPDRPAISYPSPVTSTTTTAPYETYVGGGQLFPPPTLNAYNEFTFNTPNGSHKLDYKKFGKGGNISIAAAGALPSGDGQLRRQLKERHIQLIAIGGCIGTGLFLGTAESLTWGGPGGLLLGYAAMGSIVYCIMISLGEMIAHLPLPGGHITLADRFVDSAFSFTMGWNYWYNWTIVLPAELNASAILFSYWNNSINPSVWMALCLVVTVVINCGGTRAYGETEFIFASIKIITIVGLIILGVVLDAGGGPSHKVIGVSNWTRAGGPFREYLLKGAFGKFLGFWAVLTQAAFSYIGVEITAIAGGEAKNPRKSLPKAIKGVYIRILLFYVLGVFIIGLLVDSYDPRLNLNSGTAASSPFVIAINDAGIKALPSVVNAALLTSAWSAASSDLYTSSRALYGLAINGNAPAVCAKVSSWGLPWVALLVGIAFSFLSFMSAGAADAGVVFGWFSSMTSCFGLITWAGIAWTYIRFYNGAAVQGVHRELFPYHGRLQPFAAWYALIGCCIILVFNGFRSFVPGHWDTAQFVTSYLPLFLFPITYCGARWWKRSEVIEYIAMDYFSGSRDTTMDEYDSRGPGGVGEKLWGWIV